MDRNEIYKETLRRAKEDAEFGRWQELMFNAAKNGDKCSYERYHKSVIEIIFEHLDKVEKEIADKQKK